MRAEGVILENALERRPTPRFELLLIADDVVEEYFRERNLNYTEQGELKQYLSQHAPSTRVENGFGSTINEQTIMHRLREAAEGWFSSRNDEKKA